jgi:hypothetical protein
VRLWSPEELTGRCMECDNHADCGGRIPAEETMAATMTRARAKGWHIYTGSTGGGEEVVWILCPACVGARARLPRAPDVLPGQEQLF